MKPEPGYYYHFKHNNESINNYAYEVIDVAMSTESEEKLVIYKALYGDRGMYARPLEMFMDDVDRDGYQGPRFKKIEDHKIIDQLKQNA